jgi:NADH:ubiquinone oxidoreductase subunit K
MAEEEGAMQNEKRQELVEALQGWHRARASAGRYNRNLLQYGAGIAAVLGIEAGSGGIFAIANSLGAVGGEVSLPVWAVFTLVIIGVLAAAVTIILAILLVDTYRRREAAESEAARCHDKLIALEPDRFLSPPE